MTNKHQSKAISIEHPAQRATCVIEALENRQLFASTTFPVVHDDPNFKYDPITVSFRNTDLDNASQFVVAIPLVLKDSRILLSISQPSNDVLILNPDGSISKSFNLASIHRPSQAINLKYEVVLQLDDQSALVSTQNSQAHYLERLMLDGTIDAKFGISGKLPVADAEYRMDGDNLTVYSYPEQKIIIDRYTVRGKRISQNTVKLSVENTNKSLTEDGSILVTQYIDGKPATLTKYNSDGELDSQFGNAGSVDINASFRKWAQKQIWKSDVLDQVAGDFTGVKTYSVGYVPQLRIENIVDGSASRSYTLRAYIDNAFTDSISTQVGGWSAVDEEYSPVYTTLDMTFDDYRKSVVIHPRETRWETPSVQFFDASPMWDYFTAGDFQFSSRNRINFTEPYFSSYYLFPISSVSDHHGGFYIAKLDDIVGTEAITHSVLHVIHTLPFVSTISGRAFSDSNGDGVRQSGEKLLAGQQVYIDENGNGKYDIDELTTTTDAKGHYQFTGLYKGIYKVRVVPPKYQHVTTPVFSNGSITLKLGQSKWGEIGVSV